MAKLIMINTERVRRSVFWFVDRLRASKIRSNYEDIKYILEKYDEQESSIRRDACLKKILYHAVETTQFYVKFRDFKSISDFPVINKMVIRDNYEAFLSDKYKSVKNHKVTTSGSTGAPLTVWQDAGKRERHKAENIYFSELAGYPLGSRLYYLRVWNDINRKSFFERVSQNIIMQDAGDLSDNTLSSFIDKLKRDPSNKSILAFSSTHEALGQFVNNRPHPLPLNVNSLITISETLPDGAKEILRSAFNCPVVSRYSNMENGFLAQQCIEENNEYHINTASFHIEMLHPEKDEPASYDQPGRIIVTDLFNYAMPVIRYDTGDMAIMSEKSSCGKPGPVFRKVEGRKVDFISDTRGNLLSPHVVTNTMWKYSAGVRQFQFIQNGAKDYLVRLSCIKTGFGRETELLTDLKYYLGKDANIELELVIEIPVLASGKRKKIINNFIKL